MAELGVIASGMGVASLAMQIGESIMKLKNFMDAVKEAPADIKDMVEHIEALSVILSEFSDDEGPYASLSATKCLNLCRKSAGTLQAIVTDLENEIRQRRFRGGVKFVLKEGTLNKLKAKLTNAQDVLMMSHSLSFDVDGEGEAQEPAIGLNSGSNPFSTTNTVGQACRTHNTSKSKKKQLRINTASLSWLTKRAWEVCCYQAYSGWNVTIRTYNVLPMDSTVFYLAIDGDIAGLQEMFQTGKASVYDVDSKGWTLLDLAAWYYHLDACRMLLEEGADPNVSAYGSAVTMATTASDLDLEHLRRKDAVSFDIIRSLTAKLDQDIFSEELSICYWNVFGPPTEAFEWLFQQWNPYYTPRSVSECWRIALEIAGAEYYANSISLIRVVLKGWDIESTLCNTKNVLGHNLIWYMAYDTFGEMGFMYI